MKNRVEILSRNIFNLIALGQYDFGLQTIEINVDHVSQENGYIENIINTNDLNSLSNTELEIYKTIRHEFTHLLDSTTTLWGMEYSCRMYHWLQNPINRNLEVFLLNDTEIQMHHKLNISHKISQFEKVKYSLEYNQDVGVYILIHYLDEQDDIIQSTPVTMLSLLEVHAYAQENLFAYDLYNQSNNFVSKKILDRKIKKDINTLTISEYTCLLALLDQLLPIHSLESKIKIAIVAARLSLNFPDFLMALIPETLLIHIYNKAPKQLVSSLHMELTRGMHRSTLCMIFIIVFCISKQNDNSPLAFSEIEEIMLDILTTANRNTASVKEMMQMHWDITHEVTIELLNEKNAHLASSMATKNKDNSWYEFDISTIPLPDFYLSTGELVKMPNHISFDMDTHLEKNMRSITTLEKKLKTIKLMRQHLTPAVYHDMNERRKAGDFSTVYYPNSSNSL